MSAVYFWIMMAAGLAILELMTPGNLISIWFSLSSLLAAGVSLFADESFFLQTTVFVLFGFVIMFILRRFLVAKMQGAIIPIGTDLLIGRRIKLTEPFDENGMSKVVIRGVAWTLEYRGSGEASDVNVVTVVSIEGNRIICE